MGETEIQLFKKYSKNFFPMRNIAKIVKRLHFFLEIIYFCGENSKIDERLSLKVRSG